MHASFILLFLLVASATADRIRTPTTLYTQSKRTHDGKRKVLDNALKIRGGAGSDVVGQLDWRFFLAGGICAATSHGITTPIDVVKTRMQTDPDQYKKGVVSAANDIIKAEGIMFLLAGLGPTVVGYGLEGALKFGAYETFKVVFKSLTPHQFLNFLAASVVAGAIASIVLCPMEDTRIRMVGDASYANENLVSALVRIVKEDGLFKTFNGLAAMLSKQVPYTMTKQVSFDIISKLFYALAASKFSQYSKETIKMPISIVAAFLTSILACLGSQPGDMILTEFYKNHAKKSFGEISRDIYLSHGLRGFFIGTTARLVHVGSIITTQLVIYDLVKVALGLKASGSH